MYYYMPMLALGGVKHSPSPSPVQASSLGECQSTIWLFCNSACRVAPGLAIKKEARVLQHSQQDNSDLQL